MSLAAPAVEFPPFEHLTNQIGSALRAGKVRLLLHGRHSGRTQPVTPPGALATIEHLPWGLSLVAGVPGAHCTEVPIFVANRIIGLLEIERDAPLTQTERELLDTCASAMAIALAQRTPSIGRRRSARLAEVDWRSADFLSSASVAIGLEQDIRGALQTAARLLVPFFADWCAIDCLVGLESHERVAEAAWRGGEPVPPPPADWYAEVARSHQPAQTRAGADGPTYIVVPIVRHEVPLGLLVTATGAQRPYSAEDLSFTEEYARRIGAAVGHAWPREPDIAWRADEALLATVSHELRTPIAAVLGWTRLLQTGRVTGAAAERALAAIHRSTEMQARLVADMFDLSRILMGTYRLRVAPIDLAAIAETVVEAVQPDAAARVVDLQCEADAASMLGDGLRLQQALINLTTNSIKHTPPGGRVKLRVTADDESITITVSDTGDGIEPELLPHMFEPLQHGNDGDASKIGIGLGLAFVKQIALLHGGSVSAYSEGRGCGAVVTMVLPHRPPAHRVPRSPAVEWAAPPDPTALAGLHLMVVSDDAVAREQLREALAANGAEVAVAPSAAGALRERSPHAFDLIVCDLGQGEREALVHGVGAPDRPGAVPLLAISGYARGDDHLRFLAAGFQLHLKKPVASEELVRAVLALTRDAQ